MKKGNVTKYIQKLKASNLPAIMVGQENGLGLKEVFHPAYDRTIKQPKRMQITEFYGNFSQNHQFYSENYKHLLTNLKSNDHLYSNSENVNERMKIAKLSISLWDKFVEEESANIPKEDTTFSNVSLNILKEVFERQKERNKNYLPAEEILNFHYEFAKNRDFDFPLDPKSLAIILHPHWGYLCKFTRKNFTFDEIIEFYKYEFFSTYLRKQGRDILANRITALNFWKIIDKENKGFLDFKRFLELLHSNAFEIENVSKFDKFQNEFDSVLINLPNEFLDTKHNLFRYRLFEYLYLERCAIY